ncbi:hypothetical protein AzCIB_3377 [Azoarcus sp. CIB]|uniref:hypothetical protein n=1 Tax=Aromatoleum sp. (strain CIB) TaxID=198107 RepID=UPI00067B5BB2|nr:hypothetical protein [Azoarcus sp. CIB]AKU13270.1 hypothetical protein AzCIB_3377 [Azoarcus sp. CIB]
MIRPSALAAACAGIIAGTVATFAQMLLWWLDGTPVIDTLLRDARLTAAIVMGAGVLGQGPVWRWDVMACATAVHFALSYIYALIAWPLARTLNVPSSISLGAVYGAAIYVINLHGFTHVFPWFDVSRGWVTILAHLVFGAALFASCAFLAQQMPHPHRSGSPNR